MFQRASALLLTSRFNVKVEKSAPFFGCNPQFRMDSIDLPCLSSPTPHMAVAAPMTGFILFTSSNECYSPNNKIRTIFATSVGLIPESVCETNFLVARMSPILVYAHSCWKHSCFFDDLSWNCNFTRREQSSSFLISHFSAFLYMHPTTGL